MEQIEKGYFKGPYTVKVGDVCYGLIGQIVNRYLIPVRYQPSGILVVNSPLKMPELIKRVKDDWENVTIKRLAFYYPSKFEALKEGELGGKIRQLEKPKK